MELYNFIAGEIHQTKWGIVQHAMFDDWRVHIDVSVC